jgi:peptide/nickel transport system substrate-binding protein
MNCDACKDRLLEYLLDELDATTHREVEQALTGCTDCQRELELLKRMLAGAADAPRLEFDAARRNRVLDEAVRVAGKGLKRNENPWYTHPSFLMAASALLAVGATIALLQLRADDDAPPQHADNMARANEPAPAEAAAAPQSPLALEQAAVNEAGLPTPEQRGTTDGALGELTATPEQPADAIGATAAATQRQAPVPPPDAARNLAASAREQRSAVDEARGGGGFAFDDPAASREQLQLGLGAAEAQAEIAEDALLAEREEFANEDARIRGPAGLPSTTGGYGSSGQPYGDTTTRGAGAVSQASSALAPAAAPQPAPMVAPAPVAPARPTAAPAPMATSSTMTAQVAEPAPARAATGSAAAYDRDENAVVVEELAATRQESQSARGRRSEAGAARREAPGSGRDVEVSVSRAGLEGSSAPDEGELGDLGDAETAPSAYSAVTHGRRQYRCRQRGARKRNRVVSRRAICRGRRCTRTLRQRDRPFGRARSERAISPRCVAGCAGRNAQGALSFRAVSRTLSGTSARVGRAGCARRSRPQRNEPPDGTGGRAPRAGAVRRFAWTFVLLGFALVGCRAATDENTLVVAVDSRPRVFDPRLATSDIDGRIVRLLFAGLTTVDTSDARPSPLLARSVARVSATEVVATVREGLRFHDGSALDAHDVLCTIESLHDERVRSPFAADWRSTRVEVVNPHELRFVTEEPDPTLELRLELGVLPCEWTASGQTVGVESVVGSGPWSLQTQERDGTLVLGAFAEWWQGAPAFDHVRIRPIADANTRVMGLLSGTIDVVANGVPPELLPVIAEDDALAISRGSALRYTYLVFQLDRIAFADVRTRRAIALAIDREAIVEHRFGGAATLASGMLPPSHWAYVPSPQVAHDAQAAAALVAAAHPGVDADGCRVRGTLSSSSNRLYRGIAGIIVEQLRAIGVCLEQRSYEWATFFADVKAGDFDIALLQWTSIVDPGHYAWAFHSSNIPSPTERSAGGNRGRWRDSTVDALLDAADVETDQTQRVALYAQVQAQASSAMPYVSLWHEDNIVVYRAELDGIAALPTGRLAWLSVARHHLETEE